MILSSKFQFLMFSFLMIVIIFFTFPTKMKMANLYYESYKYDKAYEYLIQVTSTNANDLKALKKLKKYFIVGGNIEKALALQIKMVELKPKNRAFVIELQKLYEWTNKPFEKIKTKEYEANLLDGDEKYKLLLEVAEGYRWLRKYNDANRIYQILFSNNKFNYFPVLVDYYISTQQVDWVIKVLKKLLLEQPRNSTKREVYATALEVTKDYEEAIRQHLVLLGAEGGKKSIDQSIINFINKKEYKLSKDEKYRIEVIISLFQKQKNYLNIRKLLITLSKLFETNARFKISLAKNYIGTKEFTFAKVHLSKIEHFKNPNPDDLYQVATMFKKMGDLKSSLRVFKQLSLIRPDEIDYLESQALLLEELGMKTEALKIYFKILKIKKSLNVRTSMLFFTCSGRCPATELDENISLYEEETSSKASFRKKKARFTSQNLNETRYKIYKLLGQLGKEADQLKFLEDMVKEQPGDIGLMEALAFAYKDRGMNNEATEVFDDILILDKRNIEAHLYFSEQYFEQKKYGEALAQIRDLKPREEVNKLRRFELLEELYFILKDKTQYRETCNAVEFLRKSSGTKRLIARCYARDGRRDEARLILKSISRENHWFWSEYIDFLLENKELTELEKEFLDMKEAGIYSRENHDQFLYYKQLQNIEAARYAWTFSFYIDYKTNVNTSYLADGLDIGKNLNRWKLGVELLGVQPNGTLDYFKTTPYIEYNIEGFHLRIGYSQSGDRETSSFPLYIEGIYSRPNWFIRYEYDGNHFDLEESRIISDRNAFGRIHSLFFHLTTSEKMIFEVTLKNKTSFFLGTNYQSNEIFGELDYALYKKRFYTLLRGDYSHKSGQGLDQFDFLLESTAAYYLGLMYNEELEKINYKLKFLAGGDNERNIDFGKLWVIEQLIRYKFGIDKFFTFNILYTNEIYTKESSDSWQVGLSTEYWY